MLLAAGVACALGAEWPHLCTPMSPNYTAYNVTRCPLSATCAPNPFSLSGWGCAPFINATLCNGFQSCPSATACVLANGSGNFSDLHSVYRCVSPAGVDFGASRCSCKPGPPLPTSPTLKNVLVLGDSISIGLMPAIQAGLAGVALVQHGPWSSDGGAEESAYALQCSLSYWLRSPSGQDAHWDVIYMNNGMHSTGLQGAPWYVPGQSGAPADYAAEIEALTAGLVAYAAAAGSRLLFGLTSPFLNNATIDASISGTLNPAAAAVMASHGVTLVDPYSAVVAKCGAVPQAECFGLVGCFSPHCNAAGYAYLADAVIVPAIRAALQE